MSSPPIQTPEHHRLKTNLTPLQWRTFLSITRTLAQTITTQSPHLTSWTSLPADAQNDITMQIQRSCSEMMEESALIPQDVVDWRMGVAVGDAVRRGGVRNAC